MSNIVLTDREREILFAMSNGHTSYKQIASQLGVHQGTIRTLMYRLFQKTGIHDKTGLLITAIRKGWLSQSPNGE